MISYVCVVELETGAILSVLDIGMKYVELYLTRLLYFTYVEEKEQEKFCG